MGNAAPKHGLTDRMKEMKNLRYQRPKELCITAEKYINTVTIYV